MRCVLALVALLLASPVSGQELKTVDRRLGEIESGEVGIAAAGSTAVRPLKDRFADMVHVKDYMAKSDGVTDDTAAIAAARLASTVRAAPLLFNGKVHALGYWENLSPLGLALEYGNASSFMTDVVAAHPVLQLRLFNGTAQTRAGFAGYGARFDLYSKAGLDVASGVALSALANVYSSNSGGSRTINNTNQVALLANASALSASASAPVTGINAIASTLYTGAVWQPVTGVEVDVAAANPPGFVGDPGKATVTGLSVVLGETTVNDGSIGISTNTSKSGKGFLHGSLLAGVKNTGLTIARNSITPDTGIWVSAATTYGLFVGARRLYTLHPGMGPAFDAFHNPTIAIALGERAATSGDSNVLRFAQTDGASAEHHWDLDVPASTTSLRFRRDGAVQAEFTTSSGTAGLKLSNSSNTSFKVTASSDVARLWGGGTAGGLVVYGSQGGTGTSGAVHFRDNDRDNNDALVVTTSATGRGASVAGALHPPSDSGARQTGSVYQGFGAPKNSNGNNGDVYFRTDTPGVASQRIYIKSAGAWVGIL